MQLTQSKLRDFGCTCAILSGYGVDDNNINEWTEKILDKDEDCTVHYIGNSNGKRSSKRSSKTKSSTA